MAEVLSMVASDLDRTLIWSAASARSSVEDAVNVEVYEGAPLSYVTRTAGVAIGRLLEAGRLVPVTTRTVAQYRRIALPGPAPRFAICANGGRLLVNGTDDPGFRAVVAGVLNTVAPLDEVAELFERWCEAVPDSLGGGRPRRRDAEGLFCYAVFDTAVAPGPDVDALRQMLEARDWRLSLQGRKVYAVPRVLSKGSALAHLEEAFGLRVLLAAGDSALDADMLVGVGSGLVPFDSELHRTGWTAPGITLTRFSGIEAGEEIALGLYRAVLGDLPGITRSRSDQ